MVDIKGMMFGLVLMFIILVLIVYLIFFSIKKVVKKNESGGVNSVYIIIILYGLLFLFNQFINTRFIAIISMLVGFVGHIFNYINRKNKYYILNVIIYSLLIIYGIFMLMYS